jgi:hypothetical protein
MNFTFQCDYATRRISGARSRLSASGPQLRSWWCRGMAPNQEAGMSANMKRDPTFMGRSRVQVDGASFRLQEVQSVAG